LPDGWHVFNDIPVGERGANIDHLVVGPVGVFTINTKNLKGNVWLASRALLLNGIRTDYLPKASLEARRASRLLSSRIGRLIEVRPVLAILADEWTIKERPTDVSTKEDAEVEADTPEQTPGPGTAGLAARRLPCDRRPRCSHRPLVCLERPYR
jgi:hypothetical protein